MERTLNEITKTVTDQYLDSIDPDNPPSAVKLEAELLGEVRKEVAIENSLRDKSDKLKKPTSLTFAQIADVMYRLYNIVKISCAGENAESEYDLLSIYQEDGPNAGTYVNSEETFRTIARQYNYSLTQKEFNEIITILRDKAPRVKRNSNKDLIAVNNGIFNYKTKTLEPFDPDIVFMTKSRVDYNPNAKNVTIHNDEDNTDWNVEDWIADLSDDADVVNLIWEILGAIIRPNVRWNKFACFYSETGNNGKGTLCELMRNLCGDGSYASIPIADFGKDFMLEPLIRATAIIVDENDVGTFIDKAANLKAVITNDVIAMNRKFKTPIAYQFFGFMVQCLNEFPRIKDKSDSFYRRQLFIPFNKCFTGAERTYIKTDYMNRREVLEYVMYRVLNMNYYTLSEPAACVDILQEYKTFNDPVRLFVDDILPQCKWDLLPFTFLYDLYKSWFKETAPSGQMISALTFQNDLLNIVNSGTDWSCKDKKQKIRSAKRMDLPEPLIVRYQLHAWYNPLYHGPDPDKIGNPPLAASYRGILRTSTNPVQPNKQTNLTNNTVQPGGND